MPTARRPHALRFLAANVGVWLVMVAILVVLPDVLARWVPFEVARVVGWAVACAVWVVAIEREWQARFGVAARFVLQLVIWVAAALVAIWISEQVNLTSVYSP